jgi:uncharacterized OsmC-like protein
MYTQAVFVGFDEIKYRGKEKRERAKGRRTTKIKLYYKVLFSDKQNFKKSAKERCTVLASLFSSNKFSIYFW